MRAAGEQGGVLWSGVGLVVISALAGGIGCADDPLHGPCDGLVDLDHDGHFAPDSCAAASPACACDDCDDDDATTYPGATEICDRRDNNCDALGDEGFRVGKLCAAPAGGCGRNACSADGTAAVCVPTSDVPSAELCDDEDNDCNGQVDEGYGVGAGCSATTGACSVGGVIVCTADHAGAECSVDPPVPGPERCDGLDNDCDADVDEDFVLGGPCTSGTGECEVQGEVVCAADGAGTACAAVPGTPSPESCDGLDNDCDGEVDEELLMTCSDACLGTVSLPACAAGLPLACPPTGVEICDGLDNDCNGRIDDGCTVPDDDVLKIVDIESEDLGGGWFTDGSTGNLWYLMVSATTLPGLVSLLEWHPERYGVYQMGGTYHAPNCTPFTPPFALQVYDSECGFAAPFAGRVLARDMGMLYVSVYAKPNFACTSQDAWAQSCFGRPDTDVFWLCWQGDAYQPYCDPANITTIQQTNLVALSCGRDFDTGQQSPWSLRLLARGQHQAKKIDFGDGAVVTLPAVPPAPGDPPIRWEAKRTELVVVAEPTYPAFVYTHTYQQANTWYTVRAYLDPVLQPSVYEEWAHFKTAASNAADQCPVLTASGATHCDPAACAALWDQCSTSATGAECYCSAACRCACENKPCELANRQLASELGMTCSYWEASRGMLERA